jgi:hypothetical protein
LATEPMKEDVVLENRDQEGFWAGVFFVIVGICGLWLSKDYPFGTSVSMGPGYLPRILCCGLILLGSIIAILAVYGEGKRIQAPQWRPLVCIVGSILAFAFLVPSYGLVTASFATAGLTLLGNRERIRILEAMVLLVLLSTFTVVLFVYLLQQPIPVWWWDR